MRMMIVLVTLFISQLSFAQVVEVRWTDQFRKVLDISCSAGDKSCEALCSSASSCTIEEGYCRDCIGTSIKMNTIISEIGNSIQNSGVKLSSDSFVKMILSHNYISLNADDVYNVVDSAQSLKTYRKFEKLCPPGSVSQILFFSVNPKDRSLLKPEMVYCDDFEQISFYGISIEVQVDVQLKKLKLY